MDVEGSARLAVGSARTLGRIAADRLAEAFGGALPRTPERLADPEVLNRLLVEGAPQQGLELPRVIDARLPGVEFESSNCRNFLIELDFEGEAAGDPAAAPPRTLYAKLPCAELPTRVFGNAVGFWPLECTFCERIAHCVPIRVPRVHCVVRRGSRFVLLLENLHEDPTTRLFLNRDMAAGTSLERAQRCLSTLAELHACFWGWSDTQRETLLPSDYHTFLAPRRRAMTRAMNAAAIAPAHRAAPEVFTRELVDLSRLAIQKWDRLVKAWYAEPLTLIHGDSHLGNCFEYAASDGARIGMLDFQGVQWCHGMRDVQYFLIDSLDSKLLAEHEMDLIGHYVAELQRRGVELDPREALQRYRAFTFQTLMVAVVPLGMGALTERAATLDTVLRRAVAAVTRLDFRSWLEAL